MTTITELKKQLKDLYYTGSYPDGAKHPDKMSDDELRRLAERYDDIRLQLARQQAYREAQERAMRDAALARFSVPAMTTASIAFPVGTIGAIERSTVAPNWAHLADTESVYDEPLCPCGRRHPIWERCRPLAIR